MLKFKPTIGIPVDLSSVSLVCGTKWEENFNESCENDQDFNKVTSVSVALVVTLMKTLFLLGLVVAVLCNAALASQKNLKAADGTFIYS